MIHELEAQWGQTLPPPAPKTARTRLDVSVFDKPGVYMPGELLDMTLIGTTTRKVYLRADEIAQGVANLKQYVAKERKHLADLQRDFPNKGPKYRAWAEHTPHEVIEDRVNNHGKVLDALLKAKKLSDVKGRIGVKESPVEINGKVILLGPATSNSLARKAQDRAFTITDAQQAGPRTLLTLRQKLDARKVTIADMPNLGDQEKQIMRAREWIARETKKAKVDVREYAEKRVQQLYAEFFRKFGEFPAAHPPAPEKLVEELLRSA